MPAWVAGIDSSTLVVIDEAGMADTLSLDAAVSYILERGGSVRLIGDDQQLVRDRCRRRAARRPRHPRRLCRLTESGPVQGPGRGRRVPRAARGQVRVARLLPRPRPCPRRRPGHHDRGRLRGLAGRPRRGSGLDHARPHPRPGQRA
ncbi:AAA family ATPase [Nocardioides convexus]|uniref:AAA family ATPase n=1 Tax=Nocardioides convexus TaxID=2712224 RepID=UPI002418AD17|nr:AAA family ATPase [Nocardioides convexus]